jgi:hypothetical protein
MSNRASYQSGQVGVIILLIMVVILTIGLTVASRTTQESFLTTQNAESSRVFNAAEAGIEEALSTDLTALEASGEDSISGSLSSVDDTEVNYSITKVRGLETKLFEGVAVALDVQGVANGQGLIIEWAKEDCAADPAGLMASIYYDDSGTTRVRYQAIGNCARGDGFIQASTQAPGNAYRYRYVLNLQSGDEFVRLQPVYNDTVIRVGGSSWTLPTQYYKIRSEASNTQGNETRIVEVNRTLPTAPSVMDYALYSGTTLIK